MGVEIRNQEAGLHQLEDVDFSDSDLVYHVRDALISVSLVNLKFSFLKRIFFFFIIFN